MGRESGCRWRQSCHPRLRPVRQGRHLGGKRTQRRLLHGSGSDLRRLPDLRSGSVQVLLCRLRLLLLQQRRPAGQLGYMGQQYGCHNGQWRHRRIQIFRIRRSFQGKERPQAVQGHEGRRQDSHQSVPHSKKRQGIQNQGYA